MSNKYDRWYWEKYDITAAKWDTIFDVVQSDAAYEKFTSAIGLGELLEKPEGEDLQTDKPMESYTIVCKNTSYGRLVRFSYETIMDAQKSSNLLTDTVGSWGKMVPISKEKFYAKFFNNGAVSGGHAVFNNTITGVVTDSSGNLIYDGNEFFDATAHADKVGGTYGNYAASRTLTQANLQTSYNTYTITNNRDERGEIIDLVPNVLLFNPALKFTADVILNSTLIPGNMNNDINVVRALIEPLSWAYLTDADGWHLGRLKEGLMATDRQDVMLDFWQDKVKIVPSRRDPSRKTSLIAGTSLESTYHNVVRNGMRDGLKNSRIGQSAAKFLSYVKMTWKRFNDQLGRVYFASAREMGRVFRDYDMIWTSWKHEAAFNSGVSVTN